ncbi:WAT1-related protein At4g28040-like [Asparagus officinalis]|uniref:WAT1-related protein At4g28040-like n=1 Tax=Asparagus officinalis TaxID=4686 RepID=UPI00098DF36F|nr:WAT1-related protein At4g28040-like [Asparagus officinalis]
MGCLTVGLAVLAASAAHLFLEKLIDLEVSKGSYIISHYESAHRRSSPCSPSSSSVRERRPLSLHVLSWAFLVALSQIPGEQLLLTASLRYITSTFESVELNTVPVLVFVVPVLAGREKFRFWSLNGQAKLLGVLSSAVGATVLVIFEDGKGSNVKSAQGPKGRLTGCFLLGLAALVASAAYLFLGTVIAAMVNFARIWCIHKKGPVLVLAFTPLLIVYSFLFQTLVFQVSPRFWSIVAASFVIGGLYILLWAKSRDSGARKVDNGDEQNRLSESSTAEPLLGNI